MHGYHAKEQSYFSVTRTEIGPLLPKSYFNVLDVGCGTGETCRWLKTINPHINSYGIEAFVSAAEIARNALTDLHCGDIEKDGFPKRFPRMDLVLCLDVLEHLLDPWAVMRLLANRMNSGATIVVSVPNVRYWKVSIPLLAWGDWTYADSGVLDSTHLRFFTKNTVQTLFDPKLFRVREVTNFLKGKNKIANRVTCGLLVDLLAERVLVSATRI
jgi:2-polyprenyl-3-methyl-5-hydroxy-6-metoxy-1,4-benzoquinol methylase